MRTDVNTIPLKIFIIVSSRIVNRLLQFVNNSFETGIFPDMLEVARITLILKKGYASNASNYRPISSLPFLSKIF